MIIFQDSKANTITKATRGTMITFHNRPLIDYGLGLSHKEGEEFIIFTEENLEKLQKYHSDELKKTLENPLENMKKSNLTIETSLKIIKELKEENNKLKRLNEQLTKNIIVLREVH